MTEKSAGEMKYLSQKKVLNMVLTNEKVAFRTIKKPAAYAAGSGFVFRYASFTVARMMSK